MSCKEPRNSAEAEKQGRAERRGLRGGIEAVLRADRRKASLSAEGGFL